ncbi:hypothetical protein DPMN_143812 [Dreissena polymorpha]|uniref:Uncharacterized protein n=1 Tax=Dreissena polymorpha TaxID=45954 RepID=A0A9D4GDT5_DREPO|nr:hypothetical protein DPMN_143812 [Dreissena polymorpha]
METGSGLITTITILTKLPIKAKLTIEVTGPGRAHVKSVDGNSMTYQIPGVLQAGQYQENVTSSNATTWDQIRSKQQHDCQRIPMTLKVLQPTCPWCMLTLQRVTHL